MNALAGSSPTSIGGRVAATAVRPRAFVGVLVVGGIALGALLDPFWSFVIAQGFLFGTAALGLTLLTGKGGVISLAQAAFMAIGGYGTVIIGERFGLPFEVSLVAAAIIAAAGAYVLGRITLRLSGFALAIATLGLQIVVQEVAAGATGLTGGSGGLIAEPLTIFGAELAEPMPFYYVCFGLLLLAAWIIHNLVSGTTGRALVALRENVIAAASLGIRRRRVAASAFAVSGALAALAGGLYVGEVQYISPNTFGVEVSILILAMAVLGRLGSVLGCILSSVALTCVWQGLELSGATSALVFGIVMTAVALGITAWPGLLERLLRLSPEFLRSRLGAGTSTDQPFISPERPAAASPIQTAQVEPAAVDDHHEPLLECRDVHLRFGGVVALDGATLAVNRGQTTSIIGPNGAGKTSLVNTITGFYVPQSGTITYGEESLLGCRPHDVVGRGIARTFQNLALYGEFTVRENIAMGYQRMWDWSAGSVALRRPAYRASVSEADEAAATTGQLLGIESLLDARVSRLAYGDLRRVEIARALTSEPSLLILDEPTAGMSPRESERLEEQLRHVQAAFGVSLLVVAHDLRLVRSLSDAVFAMDSGRIVGEGDELDRVRRVAAQAQTTGRRGD